MTAERVGIIGSVEFAANDKEKFTHEPVHTRNGKVDTFTGHLNGCPIVLIGRSSRPTPAYAVNHLANMEALIRQDARRVISTSMVGSLKPAIQVGDIVLPDQFLDFTKRSPISYFDDNWFAYADMTSPFCESISKELAASAARVDVTVLLGGCYVCVDPPRYETAAEVRMYARLGGDVVGTSIVPEAIIAREAGLCYASLVCPVNMGAGLQAQPVDATAMIPHRQRAARETRAIVHALLATVDPSSTCDCSTAHPAPGLPPRGEHYDELAHLRPEW
jgi:5'-methylthioadenosine phosphorylase